MKFVVSSTELLNRLQSINRVISTKNTLPILDNFLFRLNNNELQITASDLETTFITSLTIENVSEEGEIAIPARLLTDTLKEFSEQPLTFTVDKSNLSVEIQWSSGKSNIPGANPEDYPSLPLLRDEKRQEVEMPADLLFEGINKTLFATADDELRPVMNGIYFDFTTEMLTFVASDAHKLVRYQRKDITMPTAAAFILPKKPASLLKAILPKEISSVKLEFDDKNVSFTLPSYKLTCRLVEGVYPSYNSVIPTSNPNKVIVNRVELLNSIRRVSNFSNHASNLIKIKLSGNELVSYAQDLDFSISGHDRVTCQYEGDNMEIGFKSTFLIEILSNISAESVILELADPTRAGLILPFEDDSENENLVMLLMPMMIGA